MEKKSLEQQKQIQKLQKEAELRKSKKKRRGGGGGKKK
jgi:hypothetical protein